MMKCRPIPARRGPAFAAAACAPRYIPIRAGWRRPYDHEKVARAHPTSVAEKMHTEVEYSADDW